MSVNKMNFQNSSMEGNLDERITVEEASIALIREFLNRRGCRKSLSVLDDEMPRTDACIGNRADLAEVLHFATALRKNKNSIDPFKSVLEVLVWNHIKNSKNKTNEKKLTRPSTAKAKLHSMMPPTTENLEMKEVQFDDDESVAKPIKIGQQQQQQASRPHSSRGMRSYNPSINPMIISGLRVSNSLTKYRAKKASTVEEMLSACPDKVIHDSNKIDDKVIENGTTATDVGKRTSGSGSPKQVKKLMESRTKSPVGKKREDTVLLDLDDDDELAEIKCENWLMGLEKKSYSANKKIEKTAAKQQEDSREAIFSKNQKPQKLSRKVGFNLAHRGTPLDFTTAVKLRQLVFGSAVIRGFTEEWINQAFTFRDCKDERSLRLRFGILQKKGGPCGLLAALQGYFLKHLLFGKVGNDGSEVKKAKPSALNVSREVRTSCLAEAIIEILWRAGGERRAVVVLLSNKQSFTPTANYREDGITEYLVANNCQSLESLHHTVYDSISQFETGRGAAILLLYSAILSRGLGDVKSDMDDPGSVLMGAHSYCTQEMVNLLTVGIAASNTFNDTMKLDGGIVLKGVRSRSNIGLLSLFEHYGSCTVGSYLKTPRYPIWIVCSESHFSVLFCLNRDLVNDWTVERLFDLYYYDGLANQDEEMKLTVNTTIKQPPGDSEKELIPPLELCIRTKWPGSVIDWNGTEPLL